MLEEFKNYLIQDGKSNNTVNSYILHIKGYNNWYSESFGSESRVCIVKISWTISVIFAILKDTGKTINCKISALIKFNEYLIVSGVQQDQVVSKR